MSARRMSIAVIVAVTIGLAACAPATPDDLDATIAGPLQESVVEVATLAADGDVSAAIAKLDALQSEVDAAANDISAERLTAIQAAIDLVRADLEALVPQPTPTPSQTDDDDKDDDDEKPGKGNKPEKPGKP